jgi:hypothetical protein
LPSIRKRPTFGLNGVGVTSIIDEFKSILSKAEEEANHNAGNPQIKKRKQSGSKNDSAEDVFLRQLKAAKKIFPRHAGGF